MSINSHKRVLQSLLKDVPDQKAHASKLIEELQKDLGHSAKNWNKVLWKKLVVHPDHQAPEEQETISPSM